MVALRPSNRCPTGPYVVLIEDRNTSFPNLLESDELTTLIPTMS